MKPLTPKGIITRNKIIHSARKLFFTNGFEETSVRSIVADADVALGLSCVKDIYDKVHPGNTTPLYQKIILGNSILGIQQNLVNLGVQYPETYPFSLLAEYYIRQYVYFLDAENPDEIVRNTLSSFQKYHISLADSYTPIFARISGT